MLGYFTLQSGGLIANIVEMFKNAEATQSKVLKKLFPFNSKYFISSGTEGFQTLLSPKYE